MAPTVNWACPKPNTGLRAAMERIARQMAQEGEYAKVDILSNPKSMSGGKKLTVHFKVRLTGQDNDRSIVHEWLIKIEHRNSTGNTSRFQTNNRPADYDYSTLVAKNGPPSGCPGNRHIQGESAEAAAEEAQSSRADTAVYGGAGGEQSGGYDSGAQPTGDAQWPDGWYDDPWANESGTSLRWFANGTWTDHTQ